MGRLASITCVATIGCSIVGSVAGAVEHTGGAQGDRLTGTQRADTLKGLAGRDVLIGGGGRDVLIGGGGADVLRGGPKRDSFNMRRGVELAAPGNDRIMARDGGNDEINCGAGNDVAIVDSSEDGVYNCETVKEPAPEARP